MTQKSTTDRFYSAVLERLLEPISLDLSGLVIELDDRDVVADLLHGCDDEARLKSSGRCPSAAGGN